MTPVHRRRIAAQLVVAALCVSACSAASTRDAPWAAGGDPSRGDAAARSVSVVALGDSVPAGTACGCTPFPELTAQRLGADAPAADLASPGLTTAGLLDQLAGGTDVDHALRGADVVEIEIGANDLSQTPQCGLSVRCYDALVTAMRSRLSRIVDDVRRDTARRAARLVLVDYWNVWLGGSYARSRGAAYVATATELTDEVDSAIRAVAASEGATYVDLRTAFLGTDHQGDETSLLAADGDHPDAEGHQRIADAVIAALSGASPAGPLTA